MQSPDFVRTSTAAAITLGLRRGRFYRNARLGCINLLLTYPDGCRANCAYCGLSRERPGTYQKKSFIRVEWPVVSIDRILQAMQERRNRLGRVCISMITHADAVSDTLILTRRIRNAVDLPVSLLITPSLVTPETLHSFKSAGADRIGIAVDAATPELFDAMRGSGVKGPHHWYRYWDCFAEAVQVFGVNRVGTHLIVGLGETEKEMVDALWKTREAGGFTHLFSFYPEPESALHHREPPPLDVYRRIQLARYLIDEGMITRDTITFDAKDRIAGIGLPADQLDTVIQSGKPFGTSGCPDSSGRVACNRPFANSLPGPDVRNLPYPPDDSDIKRFRDSLQNLMDNSMH